MSKAGKVGTIALFILSIGAVIFALQVVGKLEESQTKIENLSLSLKEKETELAKVEEEKITLEKSLESERKLRKAMERRLSQRIDDLRQTVEREKEEKIALRKRVKTLVKTRARLERMYKEAEQARLNLEGILKESPPEVKGEVEITVTLPPSLSEEIGGKVMAVVSPLLSIELDEDVAAGFQPTLSIYRKGKLIKELSAKGIRYMAVMAKVSQEKSLKGIRENDLVSLSLLPGVRGIFNSSVIEGKVLDVIKPGFLNLDLSREAFSNIEPVLSIYRNNELFREIKLEWMDRAAVVVELSDKAGLRGIREKDTVKITP